MIINEEPDQYVFYQENRFRILSGMARKCKEEENTSGDNFLLKKLNCGKWLQQLQMAVEVVKGICREPYGD